MDVDSQFFNVDFDNLSARTDHPFNTGTSPEIPRDYTSGGPAPDGRDSPDFSSFSGTFGTTPVPQQKEQDSVITDQDEWNAWMRNNMSGLEDGGRRTRPKKVISDNKEPEIPITREQTVGDSGEQVPQKKEKSAFSTIVFVLLIIIFIQVVVLGFIIIRKNHFFSLNHEQGAVSICKECYCSHMQDSRSVCGVFSQKTQGIAGYSDNLYVL